MTKYALIAVCLVAGMITGFALHDIIFPPQTITINTTEWEVVRYWQELAEHSRVIARNVKNFKPRPVYVNGDTIWIYDTTQAQNIPVQVYSECHNMPLLVNSDTNYVPVNVEMEYQLVNYLNIWTDPLPYPIAVETKKEPTVQFWAYGLISVNTQKTLLSEIRFGVDIGDHLFLYGGSRINSRLEGTAEAGAGWRL